MLDADAGIYRRTGALHRAVLTPVSLLYFIVFHSFRTFLETDSACVRVGLFVSFFFCIIILLFC